MARKGKHTESQSSEKGKAIALLRSGQTALAEQLLREICARRDSDPEIWYYLGLIEAHTGRLEHAATSLRTCLKHAPTSVEAMNGLANLYSAQGRLLEAEKLYVKITSLRPDNAQAHYNLGVVLQTQLKLTEAVESYERALLLKPRWVEANNNLGYAHYNLGELDKAYGAFQAALELRPKYEPSIAGAASILEKRKQHKEAYDLIRPLVDSREASCGVMLVYASICRHIDRCQDAIQQLEIMAAKHQILPTERCQLHFALTRLYDKNGAYDKAFAHATAANKLKNSSFDRQAFSSMIDTMVGIFHREYKDTLPNSGSRSDRPVFIVGLPRSGTSLVEQIVAAHPDAYGAGELNDIPKITNLIPGLFGNKTGYPECIESLQQSHLQKLADHYLATLDKLNPVATRVTDKLPLNFLHLGLISLLFPRARILHCRRDPMDNCLSLFLNDFSGIHEFAYDLEDLGFYYREYLRLMDHWKKVLVIPISDISYEELIRHPDTNFRKIISACGLEWDPQCSTYYESGRYVHTISHEDVTRPLYDSAIGRWMNYRKHLRPLQSSLQRA